MASNEGPPQFSPDESAVRPKTQQLHTTMERLIAGKHSSDADAVLHSLNELSTLLSNDGGHQIDDDSVRQHVVPTLVELLQWEDRPDLQVTASCILTNLAASTPGSMKSMVDAWACPVFIEMLSSDRGCVVYEAVRALTNIVTDGAGIAHMPGVLIELGILTPLTDVLDRDVSEYVVNAACRCLAEVLSRATTLSSRNDAARCLLAIQQLLTHRSQSVVLNACSSLSLITSRKHKYAQMVVRLRVIDEVKTILKRSSYDYLLKAALRVLFSVATVGNSKEIVASDDVFPAFTYLLSNDKLAPLAYLVLQIIRRVTDNDERQIQRIMDAQLFPSILRWLRTDVDRRLQRLVVFLIYSFTRHRSLCIKFNGGLQSISNVLVRKEDTTLVTIALKAVKNILRNGVENLTQNEANSKTGTRWSLLERLESILFLANEETSDTALEVICIVQSMCEPLPKPSRQQVALPFIVRLLQELHSANLDAVLRCLNRLYVFSYKQSIKKVVKFDDVLRLVELLRANSHPRLQIRAALVITNTVGASGGQMTQYVVEAGACSVFIKLLDSSEAGVPQAAMRALTAIACVGHHLRDALVDQGVVQPLVRLVNRSCSEHVLETASLCLYHVFHCTSSPLASQVVTDCLPAIRRLLAQQSATTVVNVCSLLALITKDRNDYCIQQVMNLHVMKRLLEIIETIPQEDVLRPVMNIISDIAAGEAQTEAILDCGTLRKLKTLLSNHSMETHVTWTVINMITSNRRLIPAVVEAGWLLPITKIVSEHRSDEAQQTEIAMNALKHILQASNDKDQFEAFGQLFDSESETATGLVDCLEQIEALNEGAVSGMASELLVEYHLAEESYDKKTRGVRESAMTVIGDWYSLDNVSV